MTNAADASEPDRESPEADRVRALRDLRIFEATADSGLNRLVRLAAAIFGAPRAAIVLVDQDRLRVKAAVGVSPG
jgi:hypothetical protein